MSNSNYVHLDNVDIIKETPAAFLCRIDGELERWIPKSQIADAEDYKEGDHGASMSITEWIAEKKGIA